MNTLKELCAKYKKGDWPDRDTVHSYIDVYEEILAPYRTTAKNILEVGLMSGESLRMWSEYFSGTVYGMDCSMTPIGGLADLYQVVSEGFNVCIGDAANGKDVDSFVDGKKFDVVIEDANHDIEQQLQIYNNFKKHMNKNSIYVIEDIQTIDHTRTVFENIDASKEVTILDRRFIKSRYDDCLVIIKALS